MGLIFFGQISAVDNASIMSDVSLNISQLRILLRILRNKLGAKHFQPEKMMKRLSGYMITSKLGENYYHETRTKHELILFAFVTMFLFFKEKDTVLIDFDQINISDINNIGIVVGGDHGQGAFRFPMKILYVMNSGKRHGIVQPVGYIYIMAEG